MKLVTTFESNKFLISVRKDTKIYKICQIIFDLKGGFFLLLPYSKIPNGILSIEEITSGILHHIDLADHGKVTKNQIKFTYHPDGETHFSQDKKIFTSIRNRSKPLDSVSGHVFSLSFQGVEQFIEQNTIDKTGKRQNLIFDMTGMKTTVRIVGSYYSEQHFLENSHENILGPAYISRNRMGNASQNFLLSPEKENNPNYHWIRLSFFEIEELNHDNQENLVFIGGFSFQNETIRMICALYPAANYDSLLRTIGSIDYH